MYAIVNIATLAFLGVLGIVSFLFVAVRITMMVDVWLLKRKIIRHKLPYKLIISENSWGYQGEVVVPGTTPKDNRSAWIQSSAVRLRVVAALNNFDNDVKWAVLENDRANGEPTGENEEVYLTRDWKSK